MELTEPAEAVKEAVTAPATIVMVAGTVRAVLLLARKTVTPAVGAGLGIVTEQLVELPLGNADTAHMRELTTAGAVSGTLACLEVPL